MSKILGALVLVVLVGSSITLADEPQKPLVFRDVRIFDGVRTIPRGTVVVKGRAIQTVAGKVDYPEGAIVIDGRARRCCQV